MNWKVVANKNKGFPITADRVVAWGAPYQPQLGEALGLDSEQLYAPQVWIILFVSGLAVIPRSWHGIDGVDHRQFAHGVQATRNKGAYCMRANLTTRSSAILQGVSTTLCSTLVIPGVTVHSQSEVLVRRLPVLTRGVFCLTNIVLDGAHDTEHLQ
jgi:hypothetical protein